MPQTPISRHLSCSPQEKAKATRRTQKETKLRMPVIVCRGGSKNFYCRSKILHPQGDLLLIIFYFLILAPMRVCEFYARRKQ